MPPKKANKGAFGKGNQGYGLRNAAVDAADEPDAGARANECPPCRTCTRTTHTSAQAHTHAHARTRTRTHTHTHTHTRARAHTHTPTRTMPLARSRAHAPARASTSRATEHTCADELLQLRQQLAAQGAELQQLRQSNAALVAAADATASRSRDASARRKRRAITSATDKAHDGMAEVQQEWEQERDELLEEISALQLRPAANNAEEVELLGLFRRFQLHSCQ